MINPNALNGIEAWRLWGMVIILGLFACVFAFTHFVYPFYKLIKRPQKTGAKK